jgi:hypothetical protein
MDVFSGIGFLAIFSVVISQEKERLKPTTPETLSLNNFGRCSTSNSELNTDSTTHRFPRWSFYNRTPLDHAHETTTDIDSGSRAQPSARGRRLNRKSRATIGLERHLSHAFLLFAAVGVSRNLPLHVFSIPLFFILSYLQLCIAHWRGPSHESAARVTDI